MYNFNMNEKFINWLNNELASRGWSNSEMSRRSGMSQPAISMAVSGQNKPGWDLCNGVAKAFGVPPEKVFRIAGLVENLPASEDEETLRDLLELVRLMDVDERREILKYTTFRCNEYLAEEEVKKKTGKKPVLG